jgi:hypothetical protein
MPIHRLIDTTRVDRTALSKAPLSMQGADMEYWRKQTPVQRLSALEFLRQLNYCYDPATARLSRLHRPTKRATR